MLKLSAYHLTPYTGILTSEPKRMFQLWPTSRKGQAGKNGMDKRSVSRAFADMHGYLIMS